jgi:hypothetical protein
VSESKSLIEIGSEHKVSKTTVMNGEISWLNKGAAELFIPAYKKEKQIKHIKKPYEKDK